MSAATAMAYRPEITATSVFYAGQLSDNNAESTIHHYKQLKYQTELGTVIIIMTRRQLRSVATTLHDDRDPVPSSTPV